MTALDVSLCECVRCPCFKQFCLELIGPYPPGAVDAQQVANAWNAVRGKSPNEAAFARVGDTPIFVVTNAKMRAFWEARPTEWHGMWSDDIYT